MDSITGLTSSLGGTQAPAARDSDTDSTMSLGDVRTPATMQATTEATGPPEHSMMAPDSRMSYLDSPIVRVLIGATPFVKDFSVHETLICSRSKFFQEAIDGKWKESEEREIALTEVDPSVFLTYINILCAGGSLANESSAEWERIESKPLPPSKWYLHTCKVYVVAEKLIDDATVKRVFTSLDAVKVIYHGTSSGDEMRMLLLEAYTDCGKADLFVRNNTGACRVAAEFPPEFLLDLTKNFYKRLGPGERAIM